MRTLDNWLSEVTVTMFSESALQFNLQPNTDQCM